MKIAVDTNRILAALIKDGLSRKIVASGSFDLYAPDYALDEIKKYMDFIVAKSGMKKENVLSLLSAFVGSLTIITDDEVKKHMKQAIEIIGNIDMKDAPIVACALAADCDAIWSDDSHFIKQNKIKIMNTKDFVELL